MLAIHRHRQAQRDKLTLTCLLLQPKQPARDFLCDLRGIDAPELTLQVSPSENWHTAQGPETLSRCYRELDFVA